MMTEELMQFDMELKNLFMENQFQKMEILIQKQPENQVMDLLEYNWNIVKKYYDMERFEMLLGHLKFVSYTSFILEYVYRNGLIFEEEFNARMMVYRDIYDKIQEKKQ